MNIQKIEGIGPSYANKLGDYGIRSTTTLLKVAADRQGRKDVASHTGIPESQILEWVNRADLMRVKGIGEEYSDLLEAAGVDTVRELGTRRPDNLHRSLLDMNERRQLVRRVPSLHEVEGWVSKAKTLAPMITY